jgi:hypothetical protein
VRERHELEIECPVQHGTLVAPFSRALIVAGGVIGALCAAFVISVLLAHPASAAAAAAPTMSSTPGATLPGGALVTNGIAPDAPTLVATVSSPVTDTVGASAQPVVTQLGGVTAPLSAALPTLATTATSPIVQGLKPVLDPIGQSLTQVLTIVSSGVSQVVAGLTTVGTEPLPSVLKTRSAAHDAPAWARAAGSHVRPPENPAPWPTPFQKLPLLTSGSPSGDSAPSAGSNAIAVNPGSGLLLPDSAVSRVGPEQSRTPELLFDLRYSPPG